MLPVLETERLKLIPLGVDHLSSDYLQWLNDPAIYRYLEIEGGYTPEMLKSYLSEVEKKEGILFWAIHLKSNNKHIGNIKIDPINKRHGLGEYGIMMGDRSEWGKGFAKESTTRVIKYCFEEINIRKITLGVVADNVGAVELYKKIGFQIEGTYKLHGFYGDKYCDVFRMALFNPNIECP